jgi:hypothetical protein
MFSKDTSITLLQFPRNSRQTKNTILSQQTKAEIPFFVLRLTSITNSSFLTIKLLIPKDVKMGIIDNQERLDYLLLQPFNIIIGKNHHINILNPIIN